MRDTVARVETGEFSSRSGSRANQASGSSSSAQKVPELWAAAWLLTLTSDNHRNTVNNGVPLRLPRALAYLFIGVGSPARATFPDTALLDIAAKERLTAWLEQCTRFFVITAGLLQRH